MRFLSEIAVIFAFTACVQASEVQTTALAEISDLWSDLERCMKAILPTTARSKTGRGRTTKTAEDLWLDVELCLSPMFMKAKVAKVKHPLSNDHQTTFKRTLDSPNPPALTQTFTDGDHGQADRYQLQFAEIGEHDGNKAKLRRTPNIFAETSNEPTEPPKQLSGSGESNERTVGTSFLQCSNFEKFCDCLDNCSPGADNPKQKCMEVVKTSTVQMLDQNNVKIIACNPSVFHCAMGFMEMGPDNQPILLPKAVQEMCAVGINPYVCLQVLAVSRTQESRQYSTGDYQGPATEFHRKCIEIAETQSSFNAQVVGDQACPWQAPATNQGRHGDLADDGTEKGPKEDDDKRREYHRRLMTMAKSATL